MTCNMNLVLDFRNEVGFSETDFYEYFLQGLEKEGKLDSAGLI